MRLFLSLLLICGGLFVLEIARADVRVDRFEVAQTPVTAFAKPDADGPVVVIAHGFAGSQQMMQGYALPLARQGYQVFTFGFLGHDRHRLPMSGDVDALDGTTQLLVDQTAKVIAALPDHPDPVALIGHSMATDILVRVERQVDAGPLVLISAFSQEIDATHPPHLLMITGQWEPGLRAFALEAAQMVDPAATEGDVIEQGGITRQAIIAPWAEHVAVLHSVAGRKATVAFLDRYYDRYSVPFVWPTGAAILALLAGIVLAFRPIARRLPKTTERTQAVSGWRLAVVLALPLALTPPIAILITPEFLPVLVADYLGAHLLVFGAIQLALLAYWGAGWGRFSPLAAGILVLWCALFGFVLDRYAANFWPTSDRLGIIAILCLGAVPYMLADAQLTLGRGFWGRALVRVSFLISLGIAVALDFSGLFFLLMIAPVLVLFYLVFGTMGRGVTRAKGPLTAGLVLGGVLAWSLGVSFPLFVA